MNDSNGDRRRSAAESRQQERRADDADGQHEAVDWVALSPLCLLVCFAVVAAGVSVGGVTVSAGVRNLAVCVGALALTWACLRVAFRLFDHAGDGREWRPDRGVRPEYFVLVGWVVVSLVSILLLETLSSGTTRSVERYQLLFAAVAASLVLSSVVAGPLFVLTQYRHRDS
ncbi:hypothetical protein ACFPYI_12610 [Halomarina salina]|uniref:Uncharacterized protein n=1 Tax=Halomarina salina TaxID=1872699 RepID=A0ABD5RPG6_9EURY|nr:hypothetical protein [Halomarina salina]